MTQSVLSPCFLYHPNRAMEEWNVPIILKGCNNVLLLAAAFLSAILARAATASLAATSTATVGRCAFAIGDTSFARHFELGFCLYFFSNTPYNSELGTLIVPLLLDTRGPFLYCRQLLVSVCNANIPSTNLSSRHISDLNWYKRTCWWGVQTRHWSTWNDSSASMVGRHWPAVFFCFVCGVIRYQQRWG